MTEDQAVKLESVANTLRGMALDPRIPGDAKEVLREQAGAIDELVESEDHNG